MSPRENAYTTEDASIKPAVKVANGVSIQKVSASFNNVSKYFYYGLSYQSSADSFFPLSCYIKFVFHIKTWPPVRIVSCMKTL